MSSYVRVEKRAGSKSERPITTIRTPKGIFLEITFYFPDIRTENTTRAAPIPLFHCWFWSRVMNFKYRPIQHTDLISYFCWKYQISPFVCCHWRKVIDILYNNKNSIRHLKMLLHHIPATETILKWPLLWPRRLKAISILSYYLTTMHQKRTKKEYPQGEEQTLQKNL